MDEKVKVIIEKVLKTINDSSWFHKRVNIGRTSDIIVYEFDNYLTIEWCNGGYKIFHKGNNIYHLVDLQIGRQLSDAIDSANDRFQAKNINEFLSS